MSAPSGLRFMSKSIKSLSDKSIKHVHAACLSDRHLRRVAIEKTLNEQDRFPSKPRLQRQRSLLSARSPKGALRSKVSRSSSPICAGLFA